MSKYQGKDIRISKTDGKIHQGHCIVEKNEYIQLTETGSAKGSTINLKHYFKDIKSIFII